ARSSGVAPTQPRLLIPSSLPQSSRNILCNRAVGMKGLLVALACLVLAGDMRAADSTFHSGVDLVPLNVIVTDAHDRFVKGLNQSDFSVYEDGVQQDVAYFAAANVPLD